MREQSINRGCMARLGCLLQWRPGRVQASRIGTAHEPDWCLALAWLSPGSPAMDSYLRVNALSHRFQHPLPPLPLHSTHSTHSTSQLLPSFTRRVDVMNTSSSFQHLHLHIPIQNPHLYEIGACYAGGPRSQQFLIQLFAVTPTRARRGVPASWGRASKLCPFLPSSASVPKSAGDGKIAGVHRSNGDQRGQLPKPWRILGVLGVETWGDSQSFSKRGSD